MTRFQFIVPCTRSRGIGLAAALALAASLAGCGPADTGLPRDTARQLQELVLGVSHSAAANDPSGALKTLDNLEADVAAAAGDGQISEERRQSIMTSIIAVRADLAATVDAAAAAAKAAEEAAGAAEAEKAKAEADAEAEAAGAAQEYTVPVVAAPVPAPSPAPDKKTPSPAPDKKKGNEGKGKNKNS